MSKLIDFIVIIGLTFLIILTPWPHGSVYLRHQLLIGITVGALFLIKLLFVSNPRSSADSIRGHPCSEIRGNSIFIPASPRAQRGERGNSCIEKPLFLIILLSFVTIFYSVYKYASIVYFLRLVSYIALFYLVLNTITTHKRFYYLLWVIFLTVSFYALYGILQYRGLIEKNYWAEANSLASRFINSNHFVDYLTMSIFPMLGLLISGHSFLMKLFILPLLGLNCIALIYTQSRFGWLSFLLASAIFIILLFKYSGISQKKFSLFVFMLVACSLLLVAFFGKDVILKRFQAISGTGYYSIIQRVQIWWGTLKAIVHYPWGTGLGTFEHVYPQFRIHSDRFRVDYAHNGYLQIALELGILGLIVVIWLIYQYLKFVFRAFKSTDNKKNTILNLGILASIFVILIHALVDFGLQIPANAVIFAIISGLLMSQFNQSKRYNMRFNTKIILVPLSLLFIMVLRHIYVSDAHLRRGEIAYKSYKWDMALKEYEEALRFFPLNATYYERLGDIYSKRGQIKAGKNKWYDLAIVNFRESLRLNLRNPEVHLSLAKIYKKLGMKESALQEFRDTVKFYPTDGAYHLFLGDYFLDNNLFNEAIGEYEKYFSLFTIDERYRYPAQIFSACLKATQDYEELKNLIPRENLRLHLEFGQFFAENSVWEAADKEFAKVKQLAYNNLDYRLTMASVYERYNKLDQAISEYREILLFASDNQVAKDALSRLIKQRSVSGVR